jgi:hypothetical protein
MVIKVMEYSDTIFAHDIDYQVYIKPNPTIMRIKFFLKKNCCFFNQKIKIVLFSKVQIRLHLNFLGDFFSKFLFLFYIGIYV